MNKFYVFEYCWRPLVCEAGFYTNSYVYIQSYEY